MELRPASKPTPSSDRSLLAKEITERLTRGGHILRPGILNPSWLHSWASVEIRSLSPKSESADALRKKSAVEKSMAQVGKHQLLTQRSATSLRYVVSLSLNPLQWTQT
jgi:hypothetical protein